MNVGDGGHTRTIAYMNPLCLKHWKFLDDIAQIHLYQYNSQGRERRRGGRGGRGGRVREGEEVAASKWMPG